MKKLVIFIILVIVVTMIGCDVVDKPFDRDRFKVEGYAYVEKYSKTFWSGELDSIVNSPETQKKIAELKKKIGDKINNTNYMILENSSSYQNEIWYIDSGKAISIIGSESNPWNSLDMSRMHECILEMYTLNAECGGWYEIYYLRKGKQLIPVRYIYLPKDFEWME